MALQRLLESLPDEDLLGRLTDLLDRSRGNEAALVAHIGEVDRRRLFAREAFPSMFAYCTKALHLSEHEAYLRITVARAARRHPVLLVLLGDGRLHLAAIAKLAPHLTSENRDAVLNRAVHKSKLEIEELVGELAPRPDAPTIVRRRPAQQVPVLELGPDRVPDKAAILPVLPPPQTPQLGPDRVAPPRAAIQTLAPARYKVQFTAGASLHEKLERLRGLMRSEVPDGDLARVIEKAVTEKLERLEARRHGAAKGPQKHVAARDGSSPSRYLPAAVRRVVWKRDGGQCRFVGGHGKRCPETVRLEYHHRHPFGLGGGHGPDNISLMCPAHNRLIAEVDYGRKATSQYWGPSREQEFAPGRVPPG